jgi:hypothetical protein
MKFTCIHCGLEEDFDDEICPKCGENVTAAPESLTEEQ